MDEVIHFPEMKENSKAGEYCGGLGSWTGLGLTWFASGMGGRMLCPMGAVPPAGKRIELIGGRGNSGELSRRGLSIQQSFRDRTRDWAGL